jgi:hypothetical protein
MSVTPGSEAHAATLTERSAQHVVVSYNEDLRTPLLDAARQLLTFWKLFLALGVLGTVAGFAASYAMPKQYEVSAQYAFTADENGRGGAFSGLTSRLGGLASLAGVDLGGGASHAEIIAALRSEAFIRDFIRENDLLPVLFADDWDERLRTWREPEEAPSLGDAYLRFTRDVIQISDDRTTSLLRISAQWTDPERAMTWIGALVRKLNESLRVDAMDRADRNLQFLREEAQETQTLELSEALYGLIESETRQKMMAKVNSHYALRIVDPPVTPDASNFSSPNRPLTGILGGMLGLLCAVAYASFRIVSRRSA